MHSHVDISLLPPRLRREIQGWETVRTITADGSDRQFFRLGRPGGSCICLYHPRPPGETVTENDSYAAIGRHLYAQGVPVPEMYTYCREEGWFLLQDLGDRSLQEQYLQTAGRQRLAWHRHALHILIQVQISGTRGFAADWCFDTAFYDAQLVRTRECLYFVQAFLEGFLGLAAPPEDLAEDFDFLLERALYPEQKFLLHRDFQSRNLMVQGDRLYLIDFQGARLGPLQYDVAALLLDPYVNLPLAAQETLLGEYLGLLGEHLPVDPAAWRQRYTYVALCRNLQILGAYGFLSRQKGKKFFEQFIPTAWRSLQQRLASLPADELRSLRRVTEQAGTRVAAGGGAGSDRRA